MDFSDVEGDVKEPSNGVLERAFVRDAIELN